MAAMLTNVPALRHRLTRLTLVALVLLLAAACAGPATNQPGAPAASVQDQLAQLAASAEPSLAPTQLVGPGSTAVRPAATRTKRPSTGADASPRPTQHPAATPAVQPASRDRATRTPSDGLPTVAQSQLPSEARRTIALIEQGGPFPYDKDGATFGNREGLLPRRPSGYYKEYTVITPGSRDRGARRIVAGRSGEFYYTDDHYDSFKRVIP